MTTRLQRATATRLDSIESAGRRRVLRQLSGSAVHCQDSAGRSLINFASNDYLGLAADPRLAEAAAAAARREGAGAGSARLITGSRPVHSDLEAGLAEASGAEAAVLLPSGYSANLAVVSALASLATSSMPVRFLSDALNHASIIDALRLARGDYVGREIFPHLDLGTRLTGGSPEALTVVVTDAVFSMDGDEAQLPQLAASCAETGAVLVVDEAHLVFPQSGWPAADVGGDVIRVGTLSKALGSQGGFVVADAAIIDLLVNIARPFIFTTAMSPPAAAAGLAALAISQSDEGDERRAHLRRLIDMVRPGHPSPILPIVLGDEKRALAASEALYAKGFLVPAIRPPTVGPGTSRLRISLSAAHEEHTVEALLETLDTLDIPW